MLSTTSEYALRAVAGLAAATRDGGVMLSREFAERVDVPVHYLSKILATLSRAGLLNATRGAGGGYSLARDPSEIPLLHVVSLFDGARVHPTCLFGGGRECSDENACHAHASWKQVKETYSQFLELQTIADIAGLRRNPGNGPTPSAPRALAP